MLILTQRLSAPASDIQAIQVLALTAWERTRSRHRFETKEGIVLHLQLPRGTVIHPGDVLSDQTGEHRVKIMAKPESVLTVVAPDPLLLLRAAYHLGNRHVPLEVTLDYLRLEPDPVLEKMLQQLGVTVTAEVAPFRPESGVYHHTHHRPE
jgi:urease accessory protein